MYKSKTVSFPLSVDSTRQKWIRYDTRKHSLTQIIKVKTEYSLLENDSIQIYVRYNICILSSGVHLME